MHIKKISSLFPINKAKTVFYTAIILLFDVISIIMDLLLSTY